MTARVRNYVPAFLFLSLALAGCDGTGGEFTANSAGPTALRSEAARITAEPTSVTPTFLASDLCAVEPPFRARVSVIVRAGEGVVVRGLGFEFLDGRGGRVIPDIRPGSSTAAAIPTTLPLPLPTSSPVPIPTAGSGPGLSIPAGDLVTLPFSLQFDCGVPASGTLVIVVATSDSTGAQETAETRVRIGR